MAPSSSIPAAAPRRSWALIVLLGLVVVYHLLNATFQCQRLHEPGSGLVIHETPRGDVVAHPVTEAARKALSVSSHAARVIRVNGEEVTPDMSSVDTQSFIRSEPGQSNNITVQFRGDPTSTKLALPVELPDLSAMFAAVPIAMLFPILGMFFLGIGVFVWWKRPKDPAALPLLLFGSLASVLMSFDVFCDTPILSMGLALKKLLFPMYGPALMWLCIRLTAMGEQRWARWALYTMTPLALVIGLADITLPRLIAKTPTATVVSIATAVELSTCVLLSVAACWIVARSPSPPALRRRARALGAAIVVAFLFPSLSFFLPDPPLWAWLVTFGLLATFPIAIGYLIVRHGLFDFRIVLRQSVVYVGLSSALLLGYVGLVFAAIKILGKSAESPLFMGAILVVLLIVLSLVQIRVQGVVNRFVFRARYLYADAVSAASGRLARARSVESVAAAVRQVLIDAMRLSRAYFVVVDGRELKCIKLGMAPSNEEEATPPQLPEHFNIGEYQPLRRAIATKRLVTAYDPEVLAAQQREHHPDAPPGSEAAFWPSFGLEAVVPMAVANNDGEDRVVGLLLLGPKLDSSPLSRGDQPLIFTLANQAAVALDNSAAFDEIRALKDHLEEQVHERTRELSQALDDLGRTQGQLVEAEKQALLGRLVAGIVHEVNTPLGALRSSADTFSRLLDRCEAYLKQQASQGDPEAQRLLYVIKGKDDLSKLSLKSTGRIQELATSLRRFIGLDEAERQLFDVREGIKSTLTLLEHRIPESVRLETNLPEQPAVVECYPAKLNQVMVALVENAANALVHGGVIRLSLEQTHDFVTIIVQDNGEGIPTAQLQNIFEFGFIKKAGRMGLRMGLPSSKQTVEEIGGNLTLNSEPGKGTTATVRVPRGRAQHLSLPPRATA